MIKTAILSTLLVSTLFFQACSSDSKDSHKKLDKEATSKANSIITKNKYVLTNLNGKNYTVTKELNGFSLENAKGKVVIFDIFATWCPPCRATAPHLSALQKKYKDDLIIIGVTIQDNLPNAELQKFKEKYNADYTLVNSPDNHRFVTAVASSLELGKNFPIPIMAIYKDGKLLEKYIGLVEEEFVSSDIKMALGK